MRVRIRRQDSARVDRLVARVVPFVNVKDRSEDATKASLRRGKVPQQVGAARRQELNAVIFGAKA